MLLIVTLFLLVIFYFFNTDMGHENLKNFLERSLSKKTDSKIEITFLSLEDYPDLVIKFKVNDTLHMTLNGKLTNQAISMRYHLTGETFKLDSVLINGKIDLTGTLVGSFDALEVTGKGEAFDGEIEYVFTNLPKVIKDINVEMKEVNSSKILHFLEQQEFVHGRVDIQAEFAKFSNYDKEGIAHIHMNKACIPQLLEGIPFVLNSTIEFKDMDYHYKGEIYSKIGWMKLNNGDYFQGRKLAKADYEIHVEDLAYFEKILEENYQGGLDLNGSLLYDSYRNLFVIKGHTAEFGGDLSYIYKENNIDFKLKSVSLERLLRKFSYPVLFSSNIYGVINYNLEENILIINTNLKQTHFNHTKLSDIIYDKLNVDMLVGVYDQSYFLAGYQDAVLSSTLKIDNGRNYIYLTDTKMNTLNNSIDSNFEMKLENKEIYGKIYGTLKNPKAWINKRKYLQDETKRHLGSWLGTTK